MGYLMNPYIYGVAAGSTLADGLLAYYKLDGNSDDAVGSNDGTDNSITYNTTNGIILSGAGLASGSGSDIGFGSNWITSMTSMTVSCWAYWHSATFGTGSPNLVTNAVGGSTGKWFSINTNASKEIEFALDSGGVGGKGRETVGAGVVSTGQWYHVVGVRDTANAELRIYLDYNSVTGLTSSAGATVLACAATDSWIGQSVGGNQYNGRIDEVAIWDRVLTEAEVSELYNAGSGNQYPF